METEYRKRIQDVYDAIEKAFENVDPDLAECEQSMGSMTLIFADRSKCILSAQPSVSQLWMAIASQGKAFHFNYDEKLGRWMDDRGKGIELIGFLENYLRETTGKEIKITI